MILAWCNLYHSRCQIVGSTSTFNGWPSAFYCKMLSQLSICLSVFQSIINTDSHIPILNGLQFITAHNYLIPQLSHIWPVEVPSRSLQHASIVFLTFLTLLHNRLSKLIFYVSWPDLITSFSAWPKCILMGMILETSVLTAARMALLLGSLSRQR